MKPSGFFSLFIIIGISTFFIFTYFDEKNVNTGDTKQRYDADKKYYENADKRLMEFDRGVFSFLSDKKRVLFFYSNWDLSLLKIYEDYVNQIPEDVAVIKINFNDSDETSIEKILSEKYEVNQENTFIQIDKDENEITRWKGGGVDKLLESIK